MDDSTTTPPLKRCTKCGEEKPATSEFFHKDSQKKDGFRSCCRVCHNAKNQEYRDQNRDEYRTRMREWHRANRDRSHAHERKWRDANREHIRAKARDWKKTNEERRKATQREWLVKNRDKSREYTRRWRDKNPEYDKESARRYRMANPLQIVLSTQRRRARKRNLPCDFTKQDWDRCLEYFNHRCAVCGRPAGFWHFLAQDHWIALSDPRSDNPGTVAKNIIPLCHEKKDGKGGCNNSKKSKNAEQWLIERFGKRKAKLISKQIHDYFEWVKQSRQDG